MMLDDSMEVMTSSQKEPRNLHPISSHKVKGGGEFCNATNPDDLGFDSLDTPANLTDRTDVVMLKHWEMADKHHADKVATQETATGQKGKPIEGQKDTFTSVQVLKTNE